VKKLKALLLIIYTIILIYLGYRAYYAWGTSLITAYLMLISIWLVGVTALSRIIDWIFHENQLSSTLGKLLISDIIVQPNEKEGTCILDFRVDNRGGSEVQINRVNFEVSEVKEILTVGFQEISHIYDLDISDLKKTGDVIDCITSQNVEPHKSDRFTIVLIAKNMGIGVFRWWKLKPTLVTNFGDVTGNPIEVCLPHPHNVFSQSFRDEMYRELESLE